MGREDNNILVRAYRKIKKYDMFKRSLGLTYRGDEGVPSVPGVLATVFILSIASFYTILFFVRMINKTDVQWNYNEKIADFGTKPFDLNFTELGMSIEWQRFSSVYSTTTWFEDVANMNFTYVHRNPNHSSSVTEHIEVLNGDKLYENGRTHANISSVRYFCLEKDTFELKGALGMLENEYALAQMNFNPGRYNITQSGETTCLLDPNAQEAVSRSAITLRFNNSTRVNLESIDEPIQNYYEEKVISYEWGKRNTYLMKITVNELFLEDSPLPIFFDSKVQRFLTFELEQHSAVDVLMHTSEITSYGISIVDIQLNNKIRQYRRKVLNFYEVLGFVGGVFELLEITFGFLIGITSYFTIKKEIHKRLQIADDKYSELKKAFLEIKSNQHGGNGRCQNNNSEPPSPEDNKSFLRSDFNNLVSRLSQRKPIKDPSQHENIMNHLIEDEDKKVVKLKDETDGVDIIFAIKELKMKVSYLLSKDPDFSTAYQQDYRLKERFKYSHIVENPRGLKYKKVATQAEGNQNLRGMNPAQIYLNNNEESKDDLTSRIRLTLRSKSKLPSFISP